MTEEELDKWASQKFAEMDETSSKGKTIETPIKKQEKIPIQKTVEITSSEDLDKWAEQVFAKIDGTPPAEKTEEKPRVPWWNWTGIVKEPKEKPKGESAPVKVESLPALIEQKINAKITDFNPETGEFKDERGVEYKFKDGKIKTANLKDFASVPSTSRLVAEQIPVIGQLLRTSRLVGQPEEIEMLEKGKEGTGFEGTWMDLNSGILYTELPDGSLVGKASGEMQSNLLNDPVFTLCLSTVAAGTYGVKAGVKGVPLMKRIFVEGVDDITWGATGLARLSKDLATRAYTKLSPHLLKKKEQSQEMIERAIKYDAEHGTNEAALLKKQITEYTQEDIEVAKHLKKPAKAVWNKFMVEMVDNKYTVLSALKNIERTAVKKIKEAERTGKATGEIAEKAITEMKLIQSSAQNAVERRSAQMGAASEAQAQMADVDVFMKKLDVGKRDNLSKYREAMRTIEVSERGVKVKGDLAAKRAYSKFVDPEIEKVSQQMDLIYRDQLEQYYKAGLCTRKEFLDLAAAGKNYEPRKILSKLDPIEGGRGTASGMDLKYLEGKEATLYKDSRYAMQEYIGRMQTAIARNKSNRALYDFVRTQQDEWSRIGRILKSGDKATDAEGIVRVKVEGIEKRIAMDKELAAQWNGLDPKMSQDLMQKFSLFSGNKVLKFFATGANPFFALRNLARDMMYTYMSPQYNSFLPGFFKQISTDYAAVTKDAITGKGRWRDYVKEGGGMGSESLVKQGQFDFKRKSLKTFQEIMGYVSEVSERMTRLAHRERAIKNGLSPQAATYTAYDAIDFRIKGQTSQALNTFIPYFQAGINGTYGMAKFFKKDPAKFGMKLANLGGAVFGLYAWNTNEENAEFYNKQSSHDKARNWHFALPWTKFIDEKEEEQIFFLKIPKDHTQMAFTAMFEYAFAEAAGHKTDGDMVLNGLSSFLEHVPLTNMMPPVARAVLGYEANFDEFRGDKVWRGDDVLPEAEFTDRTPAVYQKAGETLGVSPDRLKFVVDNLTSTSNAWKDMFGMSLQYLLMESTEENKEMFKKKLIQKGSMGFIKPTVYQHQRIKEGEEARRKQNTEDMLRRRAQAKGIRAGGENWEYESKEGMNPLDIKGDVRAARRQLRREALIKEMGGNRWQIYANAAFESGTAVQAAEFWRGAFSDLKVGTKEYEEELERAVGLFRRLHPKLGKQFRRAIYSKQED